MDGQFKNGKYMLKWFICETVLQELGKQLYERDENPSDSDGKDPDTSY